MASAGEKLTCVFFDPNSWEDLFSTPCGFGEMCVVLVLRSFFIFLLFLLFFLVSVFLRVPPAADPIADSPAPSDAPPSTADAGCHACRRLFTCVPFVSATAAR